MPKIQPFRFKPERSSVALLCVFALAGLFGRARPADAGWMAKADFSGCPRKYVPDTHREEGPFASEPECNARIRQVQASDQLACAHYSCSDSGGTAPADGGAPGHAFDKSVSDALAAGMAGQISAADATGLASLGLIGNLLTTPTKPKTPQEIAAEREADERARQAAIIRHQEQERLQKLKVAQLDQQAARQLDVLDASMNIGAANPGKPKGGADSQPSRKCRDDRPGPDQAGPTDFVCHIIMCGGAYNGDSVCCPSGYPKLNECDCRCYPNDSTFDCGSYAACNYSANFNKGTVPANEEKK